jgi:hypothetical protein
LTQKLTIIFNVEGSASDRTTDTLFDHF